MIRRRGLRSKTLRCRKGQSMVEFLFVIPILMVLIFGIMEMGRHFYTRLTLRNAVMEATRFAVTGRELDDGSGTPLGRVASIESVILQKAVGLPVDVSDISVNPPDGGGPEDLVTVTLNFAYNWGQIHGFMGLPAQTPMTYTSTMKNEPF